MDRDALADFLVQRRSRLQPDDVGVISGPRRRTVGLRREEVAHLAAMSTDYYTRLEQRRGPQPSTQMLGSLSSALRLDPEEQDYLFRVAGHSAPDRPASRDDIAAGLLRAFEQLTETPALILSDLAEVLAQNEPAKALFGDVSDLRGLERSLIYLWFASPETGRSSYPEHEHGRQGRALVAQLRAALGMRGPASRAEELARELARTSSEFVALWEAQEVGRRFSDHKILVHPELGEIEVDCHTLFSEDQSQVLLVLTAPGGTEAAKKIKILAGVETPGR